MHAEDEKALHAGYAWFHLLQLQQSLHSSEGVSSSITIETTKDVGQYKLLCVVTALQSGDNNVPGNGGGTSYTVEYDDVYTVPGRLEETLCLLQNLLIASEDVPF